MQQCMKTRGRVRHKSWSHGMPLSMTVGVTSSVSLQSPHSSIAQNPHCAGLFVRGLVPLKGREATIFETEANG